MSFNNKLAPKKPFCKVCYDAGKPEDEYSSHFVRSLPDMSGKTRVLCPILASTECPYCHKLGHTTKFCPAIKDRAKDHKRSEWEYNQSLKASKSKRTIKMDTSKFATLFESDSSDDEKAPPTDKVTPTAKVAPTAKVTPTDKVTHTVSWADIAKKPVANDDKPVPKKLSYADLDQIIWNGTPAESNAAVDLLVGDQEWRNLTAPTESNPKARRPYSRQNTTIPAVMKMRPEDRSESVKIPRVRKNWAEWSESDDDDDDDYDNISEITDEETAYLRTVAQSEKWGW